MTEAGKASLAEWLLQPCEVMPIKEDLLVKLWASNLASVSPLMDHHKTLTALHKEFDRHRQFHQDKLAIYHQIEQQHYANAAELPCEEKYRYLVLRRGIRYEQDYIAWCDEVLELLSLDPSSNDSQSEPV
jgi:hypothetical protein